MENRQLYLFYGSIISLAALLILFAVRLYMPALLDLDVKWLVVAGIPLIIALIVGKYVSKVSGMGWEFVMAANDELINKLDDPSVIVAAKSVYAQDKAGVDQLRKMPLDERARINVLVFDMGRINYYDSNAISSYLSAMPNIKYFEMVDQHGKFWALMKISRTAMLNSSKRGEANFRDLIAQIEQNRLQLSHDSTEKSVTAQETIIDTLKAIRESGKSFIAVVGNNNDRNLIGVAHKTALEEYLANAVVKAASKKATTRRNAET